MFPTEFGRTDRAVSAMPARFNSDNRSDPKVILVVDDHVGIRRVLSRLLTIEGYDVVAVGTGRDAIQAAMDQQPDLVLLDLMLPDMDGVEVSATLRRVAPLVNVPIVMVTACSDPDDQMDGYLAGANEYITKPFDFDHLLSVVDRWLSHADKAA